MHAVRRTLATAGLVGFLVTGPAGPAWASPNPDPSASATAAPATTTDCGQVNHGGVASPPPPGVVCIAGGVNPQTSGSGAGAPGQLPHTGPSPLLPTLTTGAWLVLLGVLALVAGRRTDQGRGACR